MLTLAQEGMAEAVLVLALTVCSRLQSGDVENAARLATLTLDKASAWPDLVPCREGVPGCDVESVHRHRDGAR